MTEETKKQILLHLPYLFFVYLFDKIAQGFRLSYGIDMGIKLLHFPEGLIEAFSSPFISFHLSDLFIGIIAAPFQNVRNFSFALYLNHFALLRFRCLCERDAP